MGDTQRSRGIPGGVALLLAGLVVSVAGCGDEAKTKKLGEETIKSVTVVTEGGDFSEATDATMSPDGETVYFTANSSKGRGVFRVPASGGTVEPVFTGPPLQAPVGIATAADGGRVYVADPQAAGDSSRRGRIFSVPLSGGPPTPVPGTEGATPRGLEVAGEGPSETIYFTGHDRRDGQPGVFKIPAAGADGPTAVSKGTLVSPDAVTVDRAGTVFATDRGSAGDSKGAVFRITPAETRKLADLRPPVLAGLTLTLDESVLLVSSLSPEGTDQVLLVDLESGDTGVYSKAIRENRSGAGLHRARRVNVFAWADSVAGADRPSRVYVLQP
jgi:sugar lactone lactonase YvrE